jgi:hypothetical protein
MLPAVMTGPHTTLARTSPIKITDRPHILNFIVKPPKKKNILWRIPPIVPLV